MLNTDRFMSVLRVRWGAFEVKKKFGKGNM